MIFQEYTLFRKNSSMNLEFNIIIYLNRSSQSSEEDTLPYRFGPSPNPRHSTPSSQHDSLTHVSETTMDGTNETSFMSHLSLSRSQSCDTEATTIPLQND